MVKLWDSNYLAITALVTACYQLFFFILAATIKSDKLTDPAGTSNFVVIAVLTFILSGSFYARQIVLTALVVTWGLRLGIFLLQRILSWGEDKRFDGKRDYLPRLALFWFMQAVWVWAVHLPVTIVNASSRNPDLTVQDWVGWILWGVGLLIETVADQTKLTFKADANNKGRWIDVGIWKWSRHPNYFGEILCWWSIFLSSTSVLKGGQWAAIASPIIITSLLLFLSGMPILEASSNKNYGHNAAYVQYKNSTSPLIPLPGVVYESLPHWFKAVFLFELPIYNRKPTSAEELLQSKSNVGP